MTRRWPLLAGLLACLVAVVGTVVTYPPSPPGPSAARAWVTSPTDHSRRLLPLPSAPPSPATATVRVDTADRRQVWRGVGAAMTDASVSLLAQAPDGLRRLFDPHARDGARLTWVRLPLTATDMSPEAWTWGWDGTTASPSPQARAAVAMVRRAHALQPDLRVVTAPWTAPAWMKDPAGVRGGALRDDAVPSYAALLVAQADALRRAGVPLAAMSLGNEPGFGTDYPSMTMSDGQLAALGRLVGPRLRARHVELWALDHNWADRPRVDRVLAAVPGAFDAAAFHCYAGTPDQMAGVGVPPVVDECTGTTSSWSEGFAWDVRHLVADSVEAGSTGLLTWNLAVDPSGGPRDLASRGGCASCRGLLTVDGSRVEPGPELYVLAQLARAAEPGSRVLGSTLSGDSSGLTSVAFADPDGSVGVLVHNSSPRAQVVSVEAAGHPVVRRGVGVGELLTVRLP